MEPIFRRPKIPLVISGTLFCGFLVLSAWVLSWLLVHLAGLLHPTCRSIFETILIYYCISPSSLRKAAMEVDAALKSSGLPKAREKVSCIVGRETANLTEQGVVRAAVETVAENLVDGIISPLFYAAIGGAPLAMAYRMVNTLDSMVGSRNDAYFHFGTASARLVHEGAHHASPNSGYSEAAFAGALSVKLNGPSIYHGRVVNKPFIGIAFGNVTRNDIRKACDLMLLCSLLWTFLLAVISAAHP